MMYEMATFTLVHVLLSLIAIAAGSGAYADGSAIRGRGNGGSGDFHRRGDSGSPQISGRGTLGGTGCDRGEVSALGKSCQVACLRVRLRTNLPGTTCRLCTNGHFGHHLAEELTNPIRKAKGA